jgi:hypothetical protein
VVRLTRSFACGTFQTTRCWNGYASTLFYVCEVCFSHIAGVRVLLRTRALFFTWCGMVPLPWPSSQTQTTNMITAAAFSPNGKMVVAGLHSGEVVFHETTVLLTCVFGVVFVAGNGWAHWCVSFLLSVVVHLFVCSFVRLFVRLFFCFFVRSVGHTFVCECAPPGTQVFYAN